MCPLKNSCVIIELTCYELQLCLRILKCIKSVCVRLWNVHGSCKSNWRANDEVKKIVIELKFVVIFSICKFDDALCIAILLISYEHHLCHTAFTSTFALCSIGFQVISKFNMNHLNLDSVESFDSMEKKQWCWHSIA